METNIKIFGGCVQTCLDNQTNCRILKKLKKEVSHKGFGGFPRCFA